MLTHPAPLNIIILAAGLGKRMCSALPKVLHTIGGKPMLRHLLDSAQQITPLPTNIYIVQNAVMLLLSELSKNFVQDDLIVDKITWVTQEQQLGTADAVKSVMPYFNMAGKLDRELDSEWVLILCGDTPLVSTQLLMQFLSELSFAQSRTPSCFEQVIGFISTCVDNPTGFGRVIRNNRHEVTAITEERDASDAIKAINEINTGILCLSIGLLKKLLPRLSNKNSQQEYYLTDIIQLAVSDGLKIHTTIAPVSEEVMGVNTRSQQAMVERLYQKQQIQRLMASGVCVLDPTRVDIRGTIQVGRDVLIDVNTIFEGKNCLGARTKIGAHCILVNCELGEDVEVLPFSYLSGVKIGKGCQIGPYARIRPDTELAEGVKIGNFVEVKKSQIGIHSKINHLSYIGDALIGAAVNIGAGTITCNYDGLSKHQTIIEDDVHIGSDSQLVAPVIIKKGATIAAGSTVTRDTEAGKLTMTHALNQRVMEHWVRPVLSLENTESKENKA